MLETWEMAGWNARRCRGPLALMVTLAAVFLFGSASQAAGATLTINLAGNGTGSVTSADAFIDCSNITGSEASDCSHAYTGFLADSTLTVNPGPGATFDGWTNSNGFPGTCIGTSTPCTTGSLGFNNLTLIATFTVDLPAPVVTMDPVATSPTAPCATAVTARSACFSGTVNPVGNDAHWRFEYRPVGDSTWNKIPEPDAEAGGGTVPVTVQATVEDLIPDTDYEARMVAANAVKTVNTDPPRLFSTPSIPPDVVTTSATPGATMATLFATLNPNNQATTYHFEYGTTDSYGSSIPVPGASAGSGSSPTQAVALVDSLSPETTYHYRVVATNATDTTEGPDHTFTTGQLPPERGYELVTTEPNPYDAMTPPNVTEFHSGWPTFALISPFGGRVEWDDRGTGPNPSATNNQWNPYASVRDSQSGWSGSTSLAPSDVDPDSQALVNAASPDLTSFLILVADAEGTKLLHRAPDGSFSSVVDSAPFVSTARLGIQGKYAVMAVKSQLLPEDTHISPSNQIYKWTKTDGFDLIGVDSDDQQTSPCGAMLAGVGGNSGGISTQDVSDDGSRIYFNSPDPSFPSGPPAQCRFGGPAGNAYVSDLYLRHADGTTSNISKPPAGTPNYGAAFVGATPDGSTAFLVTETALPDDDPDTPAKTTSGPDHADLYRYEAGSGDLTRLSIGPPGNDDAALSTGAGAGLGDLKSSAYASPDGTRVYFTGCGQLRPGEGKSCAENEIDDTRNLYLWSEAEGISYIATIRPSCGTYFGGLRNSCGEEPPLHRSRAAITPDGATLLFSTTSQLTDFDNQGRLEFYRYNTTTDRIDCVTCAPNGSPPDGSHNPVIRSSFPGAYDLGVYTSQLGGLSDDGSTVVFASTDKLLPAAINVANTRPSNPLYNIYIWRDGTLRLLSTGTSRSSDWLIGMSADGAEAYFLTGSQLAAQDGDSGYDIYAAKVGGGFALPPVPAPCEGAACRGSGTVPPPGAEPGSAAFEGAGNIMRPQGSSCAPLGRRARKLNRTSRTLRVKVRRITRSQRTGSRAGTVTQAKRLRLTAKRLRLRARRTAKRANQEARKARRCKRAERRSDR